MRATKLQKRADRDLIEIFRYLEDEAGLSTAIRFEKSVRESFNQLEGFSDIGSTLKTKHARIAGVRKWRVVGFRGILIFYLARANNILIVRVMHSSQNWKRTLGIT